MAKAKIKQVQESRSAREGYSYLSAPSGVAGCSHDGVEYDIDEQGVVEVPFAAVQALLEHGFEQVEIVAPAEGG